MMIPFTQYHRPNGRPEAVEAEADPDLSARASRVIEAGGKFEIEVLSDGTVSMTVLGIAPGEVEERDVAIVLTENEFDKIEPALRQLVELAEKVYFP